jgi:hypothetical protein
MTCVSSGIQTDPYPLQQILTGSKLSLEQQLEKNYAAASASASSLVSVASASAASLGSNAVAQAASVSHSAM